MTLPFPVHPPEIPTEPSAAVRNNIQAMINYVEIGLTQDLGEGDLRDFAVQALDYARRQLKWLHRFVDEDLELIAWIARCLFELLLLVRYALSPEENLHRVIVSQIGDVKDLDKAWFEPNSTSPLSEEEKEFKAMISSMDAFTARWDLDVSAKFIQKNMADVTDSTQEYNVIYKYLSKYTHPTSFLLFGKESFVRGVEARRSLLLSAQTSVARLLREVPGLIEEAKLRRQEARKSVQP